jgi:hypothetical protein
LFFNSVVRTDSRRSPSSQLSMAVGVAQLGNTWGRKPGVDCVCRRWLEPLRLLSKATLGPAGAAERCSPTWWTPIPLHEAGLVWGVPGWSYSQCAFRDCRSSTFTRADLGIDEVRLPLCVRSRLFRAEVVPVATPDALSFARGDFKASGAPVCRRSGRAERRVVWQLGFRRRWHRRFWPCNCLRAEVCRDGRRRQRLMSIF